MDWVFSRLNNTQSANCTAGHKLLGKIWGSITEIMVQYLLYHYCVSDSWEQFLFMLNDLKKNFWHSKAKWVSKKLLSSALFTNTQFKVKDSFKLFLATKVQNTTFKCKGLYSRICPLIWPITAQVPVVTVRYMYNKDLH